MGFVGGININDGFETILEREVLVYGYSISIVQGKNTPLIYVTAYHKFFTQKVFMLLCNVNAARDRRVDCTIKIWLWHTMLLDNEQPSREQIHSEQCLHIYMSFLYFQENIYLIYNTLVWIIDIIFHCLLGTSFACIHKIYSVCLR